MLLHGTHNPRVGLLVPATSSEDREIGRLAAFWATSDPAEAARYGPHIQTVQDLSERPYQVTLRPSPGDPGGEIAETILGPSVWDRDDLDIADLLRSRGHDAVRITWTDGRRWLAALTPRAARITAPSPLTA